MENWIPRNLSEEDYIKLSNKIEIKTNELPIYGFGIFASLNLYYIIPKLLEPLVKSAIITDLMINPIKMVVVSIILISSYLLCKINILGQPMPEFLINALFYLLRKIMYLLKNIKN